jgi:hypothetical protein
MGAVLRTSLFIAQDGAMAYGWGTLVRFGPLTATSFPCQINGSMRIIRTSALVKHEPLAQPWYTS